MPYFAILKQNFILANGLHKGYYLLISSKVQHLYNIYGCLTCSLKTFPENTLWILHDGSLLQAAADKSHTLQRKIKPSYNSYLLFVD